MDVISLFLGLVVTIIVGGIIVILSHSPQRQNTSDSGEKIKGTNFIPSQMVMSTDGLSGLAVNERTRQICLLKSPTSAPDLIPITDLIGTYIIKNGEIFGEGKRSYPQRGRSIFKRTSPKKRCPHQELAHGGNSWIKPAN